MSTDCANPTLWTVVHDTPLIAIIVIQLLLMVVYIWRKKRKP